MSESGCIVLPTCVSLRSFTNIGWSAWVGQKNPQKPIWIRFGNPEKSWGFGKVSSKRHETQRLAPIIGPNDGDEMFVAHLWVLPDSPSSLCNHVWVQTLPLALGWQVRSVCAFDVPDTEV